MEREDFLVRVLALREKRPTGSPLTRIENLTVLMQKINPLQPSLIETHTHLFQNVEKEIPVDKVINLLYI